ncbi:MAG: DNA-processing protein DprA [Hyphomicrobiaceae bacterium]|nr:DNA-processing protein DprA [Hyphomicrobiaceae bacterium]
MPNPRAATPPELDRRERIIPAPLPQAPLDDAQRLACLRLIRSENIGPATFRDLVNHYGGATEALAALPGIYARAGRRGARICPAAEAEAELDLAARAGARPLFTIEPGYPPALAAIDPPVPMLYVLGRRELLVRPMVAIVGARNGSAAGQKLAAMLARDLGAAGLVVASGLARGIDAAAHDAALLTGTVAVVAGGVDAVYPPENAALHARIARDGCILSECRPGLLPRGRDFPRRNRLISGVSMGVVVVEAARRSGSLITARFAREQSREVFCVPGHPLDPRAEGTNALIKAGEVTVVTEAADVLGMLAPMLRSGEVAARAALAGPPPEPAPPRAQAELQLGQADREQVLAALGPAPIDLDSLARATGLSARALQIALIELSIAGRIERHGQQMVSLRD